MIAVALGVISLVVMVATGVAASSTGDDHLAFLGVGVQTTTAQVFLTGAIFGWVFVIALWLLRVGIHRSGERCAQLARRRSRASEWLGFGDAGDGGDVDGDGWGGWSGRDEWDVVGRRSGSSGSDARGTKPRSIRFRTVTPLDADGALRDGARPDGIVGRTGATRHGRGAPWRPDGGADHANRSVAGAAEQPGPLGGGHSPGPVAGRFPGIGVDGGAQRRQIGGGPGAVPGEDRGPEGEYGSGEGRQ